MNKCELKKYILLRLKKKLNNIASLDNLSSPKVRKTSEYISKIVVHYRKNYPEGTMLEGFIEAIHTMRIRTIGKLRFPTISEWTRYAKENGSLSVESIEYIMKMNWQDIRKMMYKKISGIRMDKRKARTEKKMVYKYSRLFS